MNPYCTFSRIGTGRKANGWISGPIIYNADEVELYLNGKSLGVRQKTDSTYHVSWRVPFTPRNLESRLPLQGVGGLGERDPYGRRAGPFQS